MLLLMYFILFFDTIYFEFYLMLIMLA